MTEHTYGFEALYNAEKAKTERLRAANWELFRTLSALAFHDNAAASREGLPGCIELQRANEILAKAIEPT